MTRLPRIPKPPLTHNRAPREGNSQAHLANVRLLPCLVCGRTRPYVIVDPNHLMRLLPDDPGKRGLSLKSEDRWTLPTCRECHAGVTDAGNDEEWYAQRGFDARGIALALWSNREDFEAMNRIISRARQGALLKARAQHG